MTASGDRASVVGATSDDVYELVMQGASSALDLRRIMQRFEQMGVAGGS